MAKKSTSKRISVNAFEKACDTIGDYKEERIVKWCDLEIKVCPTLSIDLVVQYVTEVVAGCFFGENEEYHPEVRDFLNSAALLTYYANITLPSNMIKAYELVTAAEDLVKLVESEINPTQYESIQKAIDNRLNSYNSIATAIAIRQLETVSGAVEGLEAKFADMFGEISGGDLSAAIKAISENGLNEEAIVKAVLGNRHESKYTDDLK